MESIAKKSKIMPKFLWIGLVFCVAGFFFCEYSNAALEDRDKIASLDFADGKSFIILNNYLAEGDILNQFKIREKLLSLPYEELVKIQERVKRVVSAKELKGFIEAVLFELENDGIYCLQEEIFINNTPLLSGSPFYGNPGQDFKIADLKPYTEHIYLDNLRLRYRKNKLSQKTNTLWISQENVKDIEGRKRKQESAKLGFLPLDGLADQAARIWSYGLRDDNLTDYLFSLRQWMKRYDESSLCPIIYKETVLMRNEHRLFCVGLLSGKEIWSFKNPDKSNREFYQTLRHPHHNSAGYEFLLEKDIIFTELSGKLIAVKIKNILDPKLLWERNLGEYTVCSRPIQNRNILIVSLINARGEFWIGGFNCKSGALDWSTYIGTCSFLSPPCKISAVKDNQVFVGTNNGVLVCLDSKDGEIIWLKKYSPKKYNLFDYWKDRHFLDENLIKYDTQFLGTEDSQLLYYKPRESDYMYILNSKNGDTIDKILIDPNKYYILRAWNGKGIFFEKTRDSAKNAGIKIIDLKSGEQIYNTTIKAGALKGILYPNRNEILFKVDDAVYFLRMDSDKASCAKIGTSAEGWLLNSKDRFLFIGKQKTLFCLDAINPKRAYIRKDFHRSKYLERREEIKNNFIRAVQLDAESKQALELKKQIVHDVSISGISLNEIFPIVADNLKKLEHPAWKDFFTKLQYLYGDEVVSYQDIEMKFVNFLYKTNLIDSKDKGNMEHIVKDNANVDRLKNYQARGNRIFLLSVKVVKGPELLNFFLLLNNDQLLCIDETGNILWERKEFYLHYPIVNHEIEYATDMFKGRMYVDDIEAYLYNNILIVNGHVNIIAVNMNDGAYMWSMTNKGAIFDKEKQVPLDNIDSLYKKYGLRKTFLKNIMFYTKFIDDRIIIVHGNKIYSVDPATGYCERYRELNIEGAIEVAVSNGRIYVLSYFLDNLKVLDKTLKLIGDFSLDFVDDKQAYPKLVFIKDYMALSVNSDFYIIDKEDGRLKNKINIGDLGMHYIETYKDNLLIITPFQKVISYILDKDSAKIKWESNLGLVDQKVLWKYPEKKSKYYFIIDGKILLPFRIRGSYFIASVDLETGEKVWEKSLAGVNKGFFYDLSDYREYHGTINFIITTGCEEAYPDAIQKKILDCPDAELITVAPESFKLNLARGDIIKAERQSSICANRMILKSNLIETENYFVYAINGKLLKAEIKNKWAH